MRVLLLLALYLVTCLTYIEGNSNFEIKRRLPNIPELDGFASDLARRGLNLTLPRVYTFASKSDDKFYHPPSNDWISKSNGNIIAFRTVSANGLYTFLSSVYQLSYRTEDTMGNPNLDVTTVFVPNNQKGKNVLMSYQVAIDSASANCAPSYQTSRDGFDLFVELFLVYGYVVNMPDHEGQQATFLAGYKEAKSVLDSIRAVLHASSDKKYKSISKTKLGQDNTQIGITGYSGGAFASAHAAALLYTYAPELVQYIKVMAIGGTPVNLLKTLNKINKGPYAAFVPIGLIGLGREYSNMSDSIHKYINDEGVSQISRLQDLCMIQALTTFHGTDVYSWFNNSAQFQSETNPTVAANDVPVVKHGFPMYVWHSVEDEISDIGVVDNYVTQNCLAGNRVEYHRDIVLTGTAHIDEMYMGLLATQWMENTFKGAQGKNCLTWIDAIQLNPFA